MIHGTNEQCGLPTPDLSARCGPVHLKSRYRTASAYLFGAICLKAGKAAGLVLPRCTTAAMSAHLVEVSRAGAPEVHTILILDKAGRHTTAKLAVPANITLVPLPPRCTEFDPTENMRQD